MIKKKQFSLVMVSVSNVPLDGRVVRSAAALAPIFDSVCVTGFTRGEENPPQISNLVFKLFLLKESPNGFMLASLARKMVRFWILFKIAWTVLSTKADVYYSHEAHFLPLAWLTARFRGAKIIYDIHEIYGEMGTAGITSYVLKGFEAPFLRSCDVLITTNSDRARRISKVNHLPASRVEVIRNLPVINQSPNGIKEVFRERNSLKCIYHGRISLTDRALDVLVRVIGTLPGVELAIIGIDSLGQRSKLKVIAGESRLDNVYFLEPVPPDQLVSFTTGADIGILPYRNIGLNTSLASPNKIWEYIASGFFVLSTPFPEALRLFHECPCGITADIFRDEVLRKQLKVIQSMPKSELDRKKMAAKQYFESHLSWKNEAEKIKNIVSHAVQPESHT